MTDIHFRTRIPDEEKISDYRENIILQLQLKDIKFETYYDDEELLALLEFGDPRAFYKKEYSDSRHIIDTGKGITDGTAELRIKLSEQITKDLELAKQLGGWKMFHNIFKAKSNKDYPLELRVKSIGLIIKSLPKEYKVIQKYILVNDLKKFAEFCRGYYEPTVKKILLPFIHRRILEFGAEFGLYKERQEVASALGVPVKGFMEHDALLIEAGFYTKKLTMRAKAGVILYNAEKYILELFNAGLISEGQKNASILSTHKLILERGIKAIKIGKSEILTIVAIHQNTELGVPYITDILFPDDVDRYRAGIQRLQQRGIKLHKHNITPMLDLLKSLPRNYADLLSEEDTNLLIRLNPPNPRDVLITMLIRRRQGSSKFKKFDIGDDLGIHDYVLMDDYLISKGFYHTKYKDYKIFDWDKKTKDLIVKELDTLPAKYEQARHLIIKHDLNALIKMRLVIKGGTNGAGQLKKVLSILIVHREAEIGSVLNIHRVTADLGTTSRGVIKLMHRLSSIGLISHKKLITTAQLTQKAGRMGFDINTTEAEIMQKYPNIGYKKKYKMELFLVLAIFESSGGDITDICRRVSLHTGVDTRRLLLSLRRLMSIKQEIR